MTTITEAQKKQITILIAFLLTLLIFISGIMPMRQEIETNEGRLANVKAEHEAMQAVVDDKTIEAEYVKLREEYETKLQMRFDSFKSNEKVEAITNELQIPIKSMKIKEFSPVTTVVYENFIAQPKTMEELDEVRADEASPVFPLLLYAQVDITLDVRTFEDELKMYDAFNNIAPVGPGSSDSDRNSMLVPVMSLMYVNPDSLTRVNEKGGNVPYSIYVFAMEVLDLTEWDAEFEARQQGGAS